MDVSKAVQKNIPILLARTSMSQATLSAKSKLSKTSIQRILAGEVSPTLHTLQALADGFGVTPTTLIEDSLDRKSLTGVKKIDKAISNIYQHLHNGGDAYNLIKKYFADDYRLNYGDQQLDSPTRTGPTIKDEIESNTARHGHLPPLITIKAAWLANDQVLVYLRITDQDVVHDPIAVGLNAKPSKQEAHVIDVWSLQHNIKNIIADKPVVITTRTLKYLENTMS